jgi:hypothetical protein
MAWTLDNIAGRLLELEESYFDLQDKYQLLIHQYEQLKEEHEKHCAGHRNKPSPQQDMGSSDQGLIDW